MSSFMVKTRFRLLPFIFATLLTVLEVHIVSSCHPHQFDCGGGMCIQIWHQCDDVQHCPDGSDEKGCNVATSDTCLGFQCPNDKCIRMLWKCDGDADCEDGSDEKGCETRNECSGFRCENGRCINANWKCDEEEDCEDGSDEKECEIDSKCSREHYMCLNGMCILLELKCDRKDDCGDGSDEEVTVCIRQDQNNQTYPHGERDGSQIAFCNFYATLTLAVVSTLPLI